MSFILAKSRVVPQHANTESISRKELIAILEGTRIAMIALKAFEGRFKKLILWTDAITVLAWLTNDGPAFLNNTRNWPVTSNVTQDCLHAEITVYKEIPPALGVAQKEARASLNLNFLNKLIHEHSSLTILVGDVAVLTLFAEIMIMCHWFGLFPHHTSWKAQKYLIKLELIKSHNNSLHLNVADVGRAELFIARHLQRSTCGSIYRELSADAELYQKTVNKITNVQLKQELKKLTAFCSFLTSLSIPRVCVRLSKLDINYDRQHHIILPKRHHFTNLVVKHYHEIGGHSHPDATLGTTHRKYCIVSGITTMK